MEFFIRKLYHCPYCNLCRVGKGLGIDYFHCMNCNACMARSLSLHVCREKSFEDNCPICHEDIFTSTAPVKSLPCGHTMHSICFQVLDSKDLHFSLITFRCIRIYLLLVLFLGIYLYTLHLPNLQQVTWGHAGRLQNCFTLSLVKLTI